MKAHKWILAKHFEGVPKDADMELVEEVLPCLNDGGERMPFNVHHENQINLAYF
jgi:hypothetical protein